MRQAVHYYSEHLRMICLSKPSDTSCASCAKTILKLSIVTAFTFCEWRLHCRALELVYNTERVLVLYLFKTLFLFSRNARFQVENFNGNVRSTVAHWTPLHCKIVHAATNPEYIWWYLLTPVESGRHFRWDPTYHQHWKKFVWSLP